jgi:hypothetical protein
MLNFIKDFLAEVNSGQFGFYSKNNETFINLIMFLSLAISTKSGN